MCGLPLEQQKGLTSHGSCCQTRGYQVKRTRSLCMLFQGIRKRCKVSTNFFLTKALALVTDLASLLSYPGEDWGCDSFQRSDVVSGNP